MNDTMTIAEVKAIVDQLLIEFGLPVDDDKKASADPVVSSSDRPESVGRATTKA